MKEAPKNRIPAANIPADSENPAFVLCAGAGAILKKH